MRSEEDIRETKEHAATMFERFDENEAYMESIGVGVIKETLAWVLEEDDGDLLEELREDVGLSEEEEETEDDEE